MKRTWEAARASFVLFVNLFLMVLVLGTLGGQTLSAEEGPAQGTTQRDASSREPVANNAEVAPQATVQYNAAAKLQNSQLWELAAAEWESFLKAFPNDPRAGRATHYCGVCLYNLKRYEEAAGAFRKSLQGELPAELREHSALYQGIALFDAAQNGKSELHGAAQAAFQDYLKAYPQGKYRAEASFYLAESLYFQGQKREAAQAYRDFLQRFPDDAHVPDVLFALGFCEEELGNRQAALKDYQTLVNQYKEHPRFAEAQYRLGEIYYALGQFEQADLAFRMAGADSHFENADLAVIRLGDTLVQLKRYDEAAAQYATVEKRFPQSPRRTLATLAAGRCLYLAGKYAQAIPFLEQASQTEQTHDEACHWWARCLYKLDQPQKVLELLGSDVLKKAQPTWAAQLTLDRADALFELPERRDEALATYAAAAELAIAAKDLPMAGDALYAAAHTALTLGRIQEAKKHAERFQTICPNHDLLPEVLHVLAECAILDADYDNALRVYDDLLRKFGNHPQANAWRLRQITALQLANKHEEAIKRLEAMLPRLSEPADQAVAYALLGTSQLEQGQLKPAEESFLLSLNRNAQGPEADKALLLLASVYFRQGRTADARTTIEKLVKDFPASSLLDRAYYRLGEYCFAQGDWEAAEAAYRQVIEKLPASSLVPPAMHELACTLIKANRPDEAQKILSQILEKFAKDPISARSRYVLGVLYQQRTQPDQAEQMIRQALAEGLTGADRSTALYTLGLVYIAQKKYDEAIKVLSQVLADDPKYSDADKVIYQLAWAAKLGNKEEQALKEFQRLVDEFPQSPYRPEAEYHLANKLYEQGKYFEAAKLFHNAFTAAQSPDLNEKAVHRLGWCYFNLGQYSEALQTFAYQLSAHPKGALFQDAAFMQAECLFRLGKYQEALAGYEKLPPLESEDFEVLRLVHAGQAAARLEQWKKAREFLETCLAKYPKAPESMQAEFELGYVAYQNSNLDEALKRFRNVASRATDETAARAQFMAGEVEFQKKEYENAVKSFFRVAYGYQAPKWQAAALFDAARCLEALNRRDQALKIYQELIEKFPDSDRVADAKAKLEIIKP